MSAVPQQDLPDNLIPPGDLPDVQPEPDMTPVQNQVNDNIKGKDIPTGEKFLEALMEAVGLPPKNVQAAVAGYQGSVSGLIQRGKEPDVPLNPEPDIGQRFTYQAVGLAGDMPAMVIGGAVGGAGGTFGLPAGIRSTLMDRYKNGDFKGWNDIWHRTMKIGWDTLKGYITGEATAGAGKLASKVVASAPEAVKFTAPTAAELTTMVTVGNALEGQAPTLKDFEDGAIILFGMKAAMHGSDKLMARYSKTGEKPSDVVNKAVNDPSAWLRTLEDQPDAMPRPPSAPTQGELSKEAVKHYQAQPEVFTDRRTTPRPGEERRTDILARKRVSEMTPEEMQQALLTSDLTGLGNKRAYQEAPKLPVQASLDADSLKWINDNMGHESGDMLLKEIGNSLKNQGIDAYHLSGDEFAAQHTNEVQLRSALDNAASELKNKEILVKLPDGSTITKKGIEFSYGTGKTYAEADQALQQSKSGREKAGLRTPRGAEPPGVVKIPSEGLQDHLSQVVDQGGTVVVYHGSPYTFDKFDISKVGTGEGAQVFGHGIYVAENPKVAHEYAANVKNMGEIKDINIQLSKLSKIMEKDSISGKYRQYKSDIGRKAAEQYDALIEKRTKIRTQPGTLYKVEIPKEQISKMLDWDKPLNEQPQFIQDMAKDIPNHYGPSLKYMNGGDFVKNLQVYLRGGKNSSDWLAERGITGIKYLDQGSRGAGQGTYNYVVFDPSNLKIKERNGELIGRPEELQRGQQASPQKGGEDIQSLVAKAQTLIRGGMSAEEAAKKVGLDKIASGQRGGNLPEKPTTTLSPEEAQKAIEYLKQPFAEIPQAPGEPSRPEHINYNYIDTPEEAKQTLSRLSELYLSKIQAERGPTISWKQSHQEAANVLANVLNSSPEQVSKFLAGEKIDASSTAQLLARKEMAVGSAEELMRKRAQLVAKGANASPADIADFLAQVERTSNIVSMFLGERADTARAMNALKSTTRHAEKMQAILDIINQYGGAEKVTQIVDKLGEYKDPAQTLKFAKKATEATTWDKLMEAWRAGLVSGLRTHEVNFLSTLAFTALRIPTNTVASLYGYLHGGEKISMSENLGMSLGMIKGSVDGVKAAAAIMKQTAQNIKEPGSAPETGAQIGKADIYRGAIKGRLGEIVRTPFSALGAEDAIFKTMNESMTGYSLATRKAMSEGLKYGQKDFYNRVSELVSNPTPEMKAEMETDRLRYTFNAPLGDKGKSFQRFVRSWHLQWIFPFTGTPGNIFKETARMTPGANLAVKEWRDDFQAGGVRRDRAMAELTVGGAIMTAVMLAAFNGNITGNGDPDPGKRAVNRAAGWKPYAVKVNGVYYDGYLRMAPIGPLMGLAADSAEFWDYMTEDEHDKWVKMLGMAFANNVTNQSYMQGMTTFVDFLQDPARYGGNYLEGLAQSTIPNIVGQTTADADPFVRQMEGMRQAMISRIPYMREGLLPRRDLFGDPISTKQRPWFGSPFSVSPESPDKVRREAMAIGFAAPVIPKKLDVIPGLATGGMDMIELTQEQRDVFATNAGQKAHELLSPVVNSENWDKMPNILKKQIYVMAFHGAREIARVQALTDNKDAVLEATKKVQKQLTEEMKVAP